MIIGFNAFENQAFDNIVCHANYNKLEVTSGILDHLYIDGNINIIYDDKPTDWGYTTILNADFDGSLEGGSVKAGGVKIESIRFQKRSEDELEWQDIGELEYTSGNMLYEMIDKYIAKGETYKYSLVPITPNILGERVESEAIVADFDGIFISDKDHNYALLYDIEIGDITHNIENAVFVPLNAVFPITVFSNADYVNFDITSTFISAETFDSTDVGKGVEIRIERLGKDRLLKFMKNGKPKVYRDSNGMLKLVNVVGKPRETPFNKVAGISRLSFSLVEVGNMDSKTLKANDMLPGISGVF